jgi:membrane fusion protein, multidrug efflux system
MKSENALERRPPNGDGMSHFVLWIAAVILVFATSGGLVLAREHRLAQQRAQLAGAASLGPRVLVSPLTHSPSSREVQIPANIHGYIETSIYAKTAGYLKSIRVDKGDRVRKGDVLAILESPELDKQVADARANYWLQKVTDDRNQQLVRQQVIAQQIADNSRATMLQARASFEQLLAMQSYEIITAPFDGMITARFVDPGALIPQATTPSTGSTPVLAMATLQPLRVYANVPQDLSAFVRDGDPAILSVTNYPGRKFEGTVTRHPDALTPATRTMLVEVDLPNSDNALYPGMYAMMDLRVAASAGAPLVADDALVFRNGNAYVPVVRDNRVHLAQVSLGFDNGRAVEITQGLSDDDVVALNLGQGIRDGEPVQPIRMNQQ